MTCEPSQPNVSRQMELPWMSSAEASPARTSALPARVLGSTAIVLVFGVRSPDWFANFDPSSYSWRTSQRSLVEDWTVFSGTWPRAGMMRSGNASGLTPLVPRISEIEYGLLPTPTVPNGGRSLSHVKEWRGRTPYHKGKKVQVDLAQFVRLWPTPVSDDTGHRRAKYAQGGTALSTATGGPLNPMWVEWLMGFPLGWTDCEPLATPSSRKSRS